MSEIVYSRIASIITKIITRQRGEDSVINIPENLLTTTLEQSIDNIAPLTMFFLLRDRENLFRLGIKATTFNAEAKILATDNCEI